MADAASSAFSREPQQPPRCGTLRVLGANRKAKYAGRMAVCSSWALGPGPADPSDRLGAFLWVPVPSSSPHPAPSVSPDLTPHLELTACRVSLRHSGLA